MANVGALSLGGVASGAAAVVAKAAFSDAAVTVTDAAGAVVEMGRSGIAPWWRRGSWDGSMVGRGGSGVRPGMLRGGRDEKDGTEKEKEREGRDQTSVMSPRI